VPNGGPPSSLSQAYGVQEADHESASAPEETASGPDCSAARDLRDRICQLADAICAIAIRPDAAPETAASCDSSRTSCERAGKQVAGACPE
jgi:hypothetical protein